MALAPDELPVLRRRSSPRRCWRRSAPSPCRRCCPDYIARWDLSKTEAGWLVGIFYAAYVVMVPVLVALTDRVPVPGSSICSALP